MSAAVYASFRRSGAVDRKRKLYTLPAAAARIMQIVLSALVLSAVNWGVPTVDLAPMTEVSIRASPELSP